MDRLKKAISVILLLAILLALASRLRLLPASLQLSRDAIIPNEGHAYSFHIPYPTAIWQILVSGDNPSAPTASSLVITENGRALGAPHSLHEAVRSRGMGAFSHWNSDIIFSSSDNRDPRTSGPYIAKIP